MIIFVIAKLTNTYNNSDNLFDQIENLHRFKIDKLIYK